MKIAFISPNPFGFPGTTGTYKLIEKAHDHHDIIIFCQPPSQECVYGRRGFPIIPLFNPNNTRHLQKIIPAMLAFDPDIVYIFNLARWPVVLKTLQATCTRAKYVLDIQTPLLIEGERRIEIQQTGNLDHDKLDAIVTHCRESLPTWIPECTIDPVICPPGIEMSLFQPKLSDRSPTTFNRFVYIASLYPKRKTNLLIEGFASFCKVNNPNAQLDIYGSGTDVEFLEQLIVALDMSQNVKLCGLVEQSSLIPKLSGYDAGIAWVPKAFYNDAPSLKALEFTAAGLPIIATSTNAHRNLESQGFSLELCDDNAASLTNALIHLTNTGFSTDRVAQNLKAVSQFDYNFIAQKTFLPFLDNLAGHCATGTSTPRKIRGEKAHISCYESDNCWTFSEERSKSSGKGHRRLTLLFIDNPSSYVGDREERLGIETADEMARRGHLVYMAYPNKVSVVNESQHGLILLPYDHLDNLGYQLQGIDPDLFFVFCSNVNLIKFYSLVHGKNIPFGIHEYRNPAHHFQDVLGDKETHQVLSVWERELMASAAAKIRLTMPDHALYFPEYIRQQVLAFPNPAFRQTTLANPAGHQKQRKKILNINGFNANKNLITLLQAFTQIASDFPDWDINVIGKAPNDTEPHTKAIYSFIEENKLQDRVMVCEPSDCIYTHYTDAHIHAIASLDEGCPTAVLEAMSVGLPSVGYSDSFGKNELIQHNLNGLLATSEDRVSGLKTALCNLMSSPEIRSRLGRRAFEDTIAYSPKHIYDQWEQLFYEAAEYKNNPERLFDEQVAIDPERAMHARRMRDKLVQQIKGTI